LASRQPDRFTPKAAHAAFFQTFTMTLAAHPIGVFDSGIGGLSVLQALQAALPHEHFVYLADNAHAPYGEKTDLYVRQRTHAIAEHLIAQHQIKALVVACNTATAAAIHELRARHPHLPLVGVEPALKPAVALSQTRRIGVIATRGTVASEKFTRLLSGLEDQAEFVVQACNGLALAIEQSTLPQHAAAAQPRISELLAAYTSAMGPFGREPGHIDTLVLGCTHYVFVQEALQALLGPAVQMVSTGEPVARQTRRLLESAGLLRSGPAPASAAARLRLFTTGDLHGLQAAAQRWLGLPASSCHADHGV
jgi:glutamate racemase